jgi:hypothetical protein
MLKGWKKSFLIDSLMRPLSVLEKVLSCKWMQHRHNGERQILKSCECYSLETTVHEASAINKVNSFYVHVHPRLQQNAFRCRTNTPWAFDAQSYHFLPENNSTKCVFGVSPSISPSLRTQRLVIQRPQIHACLSPCIKVVRHSNSAATRSHTPSYRNVLPEGRCASNGRLVNLLVLPDIIGGAVTLK